MSARGGTTRPRVSCRPTYEDTGIVVAKAAGVTQTLALLAGRPSHLHKLISVY